MMADFLKIRQTCMCLCIDPETVEITFKDEIDLLSFEAHIADKYMNSPVPNLGPARIYGLKLSVRK
jgi:hypothetical protein